MLTSGGDCQGLNSALRGVAKSLYCRFGNDVELYGVRDGYRGLIEDDIRKMNRNDFSGIHNAKLLCHRGFFHIVCGEKNCHTAL